ncbi:MAG: hypothetical protein SynsKO_29350 [Synoicihabitans sp.]
MPSSDILSAPEEQVVSICSDDECYSRGVWFQAKSISMIELSQLGEIIGADSYDDLSSGFNLVGEPLEEGPWPQTPPPSLSEKIENLSNEEIEAAAQSWSQIEEFGGHVTPSDLADYIKRLKEFFANTSGPYFLVNSL